MSFHFLNLVSVFITYLNLVKNSYKSPTVLGLFGRRDSIITFRERMNSVLLWKMHSSQPKIQVYIQIETLLWILRCHKPSTPELSEV